VARRRGLETLENGLGSSKLAQKLGRSSAAFPVLKESSSIHLYEKCHEAEVFLCEPVVSAEGTFNRHRMPGLSRQVDSHFRFDEDCHTHNTGFRAIETPTLWSSLDSFAWLV